MADDLRAFCLSCFLFVQGLAGVASAQDAPGVPSDLGDGCSLVSLEDSPAMAALINAMGLGEFQNPPEVRPVSESTRLDLVVDYAAVKVAGCSAYLRTYNGSIVGPTIRAKPGETLHIRLINNLDHVNHPHPQQPPPAEHAGHFSFNLTNLHTHGLHVAPQGPGPVDPDTGRVPFESDNVLIELGAGEQQDYRIVIPSDHPAGTFWYHAHVHGATAVQVASGMVGALVVDGGTADHGDLATLPAVATGKEKLFILQQIQVGTNGRLENLPTALRPTLVNGQLVPVIRMRPGEIQRWRFIHAGVQENISLAVDGHKLHEVAADGISLGRSVPWPEAPESGVSPTVAFLLHPGYRTDVLVRATDPEPGKRYFLRDLRLEPDLSIQAAAKAFDRSEEAGPTTVLPVDPGDMTPGQILAEIIIEGEPMGIEMPSAAALAAIVPSSLPAITDEEIAATKAIDPNAGKDITFNIAKSICNPQTGSCQPCTSGADCKLSFLVNGNSYSSRIKTTLHLKTGGKWTAAEWRVEGKGAPHPFHIHVNPFQTTRLEPGTSVPVSVWKDTLLVEPARILRMRYTEFAGQFVLHCHILQHEDKGMIEVVPNRETVWRRCQGGSWD